MKAKSNSPFNVWRIALIASTLALGACDAVNEIVTSNDGDNVNYYVSLGTSLSVGVQPNSSGVLLPTNDGYPDQLYDSIRSLFETGAAGQTLEHVSFGCPGETLDRLMNGGSCPYVAGSQLEAAVDFLNDNSGRVHLVTIDIGGNDFRNAGCIGATVDIDCVNAVTDQIAMDLATVLADLNDAAGPSTTIVGMNYYNPYLGSWIENAAGQTLATQSIQAAVVLNDALSTTYTTAGVTMANVYMAFDSENFNTMVPSPPNGDLPMAVANICQFTYMCDADPVGPDIHANTAGYSLIAATIEAAML